MHELDDMELLVDGAKQLGIDLTDRQLEQFSIYMSVLLEWNEKFNLTRITDPRDIVIKHFLDSLSCFSAYSFPLDARVIDVGSGAGFPGIPLEIVRPDLNITLLDSTRKRLAFLEEAATQLELAGISILEGRAEEAGRDRTHRAFYQVVMARAVARMNILMEYLLPLVRRGGVAIAQKGPDVREELAEAAHSISLLGGELESIVQVTLPHSGIHRNLVVVRKIAATTSPYPRRAAVIQKEPL